MSAFGRQATQRLAAWTEALSGQLYTPVEEVSFTGFVCGGLTIKEAAQVPKIPYPAGTSWGKDSEYGYFEASVPAKPEWKGRRLVLFSGLGGEQLIYSNGLAIGSIDRKHTYVTLSRELQGNENFYLLIESYAGHGLRLENLPPCAPDMNPLNTPVGTQCKVGKSFLALWNEDVYRLWLDAGVLTSLYKVLPEDSLRAEKIAEALYEMTYTADPSLPPEKRDASCRLAREKLRGVLEAKNSSSAPEMLLIGQSHIDLAWLWSKEETRRKSVRTFSNQLTLMEEYPEYKFLLCEPALMQMLKERDPECYSRVLQKVGEGQFLPEGAFYVESDTNIPSGETLIRQLLWGKKWYKEELGYDTRVAWQPDTFGFSGALPQILKKCGVPYFASQKLTRQDPECEPFPYTHFVWEGIDGSEVIALNFHRNNSPISPEELNRRWYENRSQKGNIDCMLFPFGYGDGGGGPVRDMPEIARRVADLEGIPKCLYTSLDAYMDRIAPEARKNRWVGEMYLAWHRGTYSVQVEAKRLLRVCEGLLHKAELLAAMEEDPTPYLPAIKEAWEKVLFNTFHDLAGGVGIKRVHSEMRKELESAIDSLKSVINCMLGASLIAKNEGLCVFNALPFARRQWVTMPDGKAAYIKAEPSCVTDVRIESRKVTAAAWEDRGGFRLENEYLSLLIDYSGRITEIVDKENGIPLTDNGQVMNDWRLYENVQCVYDAWEMDADWEKGLIADAFKTECDLTVGPYYAEVEVRRSFGASSSVQKIRLTDDSRRVDFVTEVNWQEDRKMLKTHFISNIRSEYAIHEIQFGYVSRPAHRSHPFARDRFEVCQNRYSVLAEMSRGFALLNDGIRGISSGRGELALTLLRSPMVPDNTCDRGVHTFRYALYPFATDFGHSDVVKEAYAFNDPPEVLRGSSSGKSGFSVSSRSVILETVKPADDGDGIILRLYESMGGTDRAVMNLPFKAEITECAMDETRMEIASNELIFKPFEIRTFRVRRK